MKRRSFLQLIGAVVSAPAALAKAAMCKPEPEVVVEAAQTKGLDWAQAELDRISDVVNHGGVSVIYMSKQLIDELNNRTFHAYLSLMTTANPVLKRDNLVSPFRGIMVLQDQMLPMKTEKGDVHSIAVERPYKIFRNASYHMVALEDIPKDGYGWAQIMPG